LPLFSELNRAERELIAKRSYLSEYKKDQVIYYEGQPPDAFYYLVTGRVRIFTKDDKGQENNLEYLHRGKYFGIISLLTGEPHSVTAITLNDSIILKIEKKDFDFLLRKIPKLAIDLSLTLSRRLKRKDIHQKRIFESTIIAIYSIQRGSGKTTYAINLALGLKKETNKNVIIVDLSTSEFDISRILGLPEGLASIDLSSFSFDYSNLLNSILRNRLLEIDILNIKYEKKSLSCSKKISAILSLLTNDYHFIIVDLPSDDEIILEALDQSDSIHLISGPNRSDLKQTYRLIQQIKQKIRYKEEKIKIIINESIEGIAYSEKIKILKQDIYATLPKLDIEEKERAIIEYPETGYAKTIRRISRQIGDVLVGLALGAGAAYGLSHIGVLKVIEEENIPIDVISGSSIGALVGSLWAIGKNSKEIAEIFKSEFSQPKNIFKLLDFGFPKIGFIKGRKIKRLLEKYLENKTFYDLRLPLKILACDVKRKCSEIIDKGYLSEAVMASCAMPGVFRPVRYKEELLLDGGILNPLPTDVLVKMGIKKIIGVNVTPLREDILEKFKEIEKGIFPIQRPLGKDIFKTNIFDMIFSSIELMQAEIEKSQASLADIVLHPDLFGLNWLEFHRVEEFVKRGEVTARENLEEIKRIVYE
jgi:NTE family protein